MKLYNPLYKETAESVVPEILPENLHRVNVGAKGEEIKAYIDLDNRVCIPVMKKKAV